MRKFQWNKKGVALLQVLIIAAVLAGLSTMILRAIMPRTRSARMLRRTVEAQMLIEACRKEIAEIWAAKDPQRFADDLANCRFFNKEDPEDQPPGTSAAHVVNENGEVVGADPSVNINNEERDYHCSMAYGTEVNPSTISGPYLRVYAYIGPGNLTNQCVIKYRILGGASRL
ncbi:MAG: hypothetical protein II913_05655 [Elusimicrobiaceae bacterium]|nr:hypothetical protein [Elusimicrobiaceae bacterium]